MIQKIQAFEIPGIGVAKEVKIELQSRFTTQETGVLYYDLRDPTQTSIVTNLSDRSIQFLPYKIISYSKIRLNSEDLNTVINDEKRLIEIFKRERSDVILEGGIKLAISDNLDKVCEMYSFGEVNTYYLDTDNLETASILSETEDMKSILRESYFVTDGINIRFWNGKSFGNKSFGTCKF